MSDTRRYCLNVRQSVLGQPWFAADVDDRIALAHSQRLGVPEIVGRLLSLRQISLEDGERYLHPSLKTDMPDPSTMKDMDKAAQRLVVALENDEQIAVFGDYDVDGATSSAILVRFFRALGKELVVYIPDRVKEGYGPNASAMKELADRGADVVITVDCGATSFEALEAAQSFGLEVIVADHHLMGEEMPFAQALINPNRPDDTSGLGQLAAAGVSYFLVVALNRALRQSGYYEREGIDPPNLMEWLDLVALGTVCDVVPLTGVNRALVTRGLEVMAQRANQGLKALGDVVNLTEAPGTYHLGFVFGPRINAGGRVGKSDFGARLLSSDDSGETEGLALELHRLNKERQAIEADVQQDALYRAESFSEDPVLIVDGDGWHPGVIGIVASRLKEMFKRPAFVLARDEGGIAKGSGRSISGVDLGAAITEAREAGVLINGGGHKMAAGLTVETGRIEELRQFLCDRLAGEVEAAQARAGLTVLGTLTARGASRSLVDILEEAGPFGAGNAEPRFAISDVRVVYADLVGEDHVRCRLEGSDGSKLPAIAFRSAEGPLGDLLLAKDGQKIHVVGRLKADNWRGNRSVQLQIEDAAIAD